MTLSTQFITMVTMIGMGVFFGAMLDTYQRFLQRPKRKHYLVFLNDLLFWIIQALILFYVLFLVNKGELRFYILIALFCGFAAYQSLLKRGYQRILEKLIQFAVAAAHMVRRTVNFLVIKPILGLVQLALFFILFVGRGLLALVKFILKLILLSIKIVWYPVGKTLLNLWKLLPKRIKKNVERLYNNLAGNFSKIKNYSIRLFEKWRKRK